tara:strand:- start:4 stop:363 length:360 start_codon:yes stop_codon:yes gene_type:complete
MKRVELKQQVTFYKKKLLFLNQISSMNICSTMCPDNVKTFRVTKSEIKLSINRLITLLSTYYPDSQESKYAKLSIIMLTNGAESTLEKAQQIVKRDCMSCRYRKAAANANQQKGTRKAG